MNSKLRAKGGDEPTLVGGNLFLLKENSDAYSSKSPISDAGKISIVIGQMPMLSLV